jgi:two-component system, OmpR family, sensor kinase
VSLRLRLLLSTLIVGGVGLVLMNVAVHSLVRKSLFDRLDEDLMELGARRGGRGLDVVDRRGQGRLTVDVAPGGVVPERRRDRLSPVGFGQVYVEWRDAAGRRIGSPLLLGVDETSSDVDLDLADVLEVPIDGPRFFNATAAGSERFRVLSRMTPDGPPRAPARSPADSQPTESSPAIRPSFVLTAISAREQDKTLRQLLAIQVAATIGVLAALGGVAWAMTRWLLRPLKRIEDSAAAIAGGDLEHQIALDNNNTEIGRLGGALNTMMERIRSSFAEEQAAQAKLRRFLADASHELRTPLTAVQGYAQLHQRTRGGTDPETDKMMDRIGGAGARMGSLVDDLLSLSRGEALDDLHLEPVEVLPIVAAVVDEARIIAPARSIVWQGGGNGPGSDASLGDSPVGDSPVGDSPTGDSPVVVGDPDRLHRAIANLVENAIRHTPATTPITIRVHMTPHDSEAPREVSIAVADTGPGIGAEHLPHVFDPFYRADSSRSRETGGAGLGLAIVASTASAFGGRVTVTSTVGEGTVFTMVLPAR